jgi:hypothetical protein
MHTPDTSSPLHKALLAALPLGGTVELSPTGDDTYAFRSLQVGTVRVFDFELALPCFAPALAEADTPIPDGARWITVHPNGEGSKGTAVLVQEQNNGAGIWHVIGSAGGSLNYLKIRGVKSEADYKKDATNRAAAKKAEKEAQDAKDKETGLSTSKRQARDDIRAQVLVA